MFSGANTTIFKSTCTTQFLRALNVNFIKSDSFRMNNANFQEHGRAVRANTFSEQRRLDDINHFDYDDFFKPKRLEPASSPLSLHVYRKVEKRERERLVASRSRSGSP